MTTNMQRQTIQKSLAKSRVHLAQSMRHQQGAVLIVGLVLLLVLTVVGTSSLSTVTLEERMVSNMQNANKAFQGAELGLIDCETRVGSTTHNLLNTAVGMIDVGTYDANPNWWSNVSFWVDKTKSTVSSVIKGSTNPDGLQSEPVCVVEYVGDGRSSVTASYSPADAKPVYRVTAFSFGANTNSQAVVESIYVK